MPLWSASEAMAATGGSLLLCLGTRMGYLLTRAQWSQEILFVALSAVRDGHEFVAQALAKWRISGSCFASPRGVGGGCSIADRTRCFGGSDCPWQGCTGSHTSKGYRCDRIRR